MKIKEIWQNHKVEIILGGALIVSTTITVFVLKMKAPKIKTVEAVVETFEWEFDNLEDAVSKFKGIEEACINLGKGEAALFGGAKNIPDVASYTVMYL